jgi:hypothetical protein
MLKHNLRNYMESAFAERFAFRIVGADCMWSLVGVL